MARAVMVYWGRRMAPSGDDSVSTSHSKEGACVHRPSPQRPRLTDRTTETGRSRRRLPPGSRAARLRAGGLSFSRRHEAFKVPPQRRVLCRNVAVVFKDRVRRIPEKLGQSADTPAAQNPAGCHRVAPGVRRQARDAELPAETMKAVNHCRFRHPAALAAPAFNSPEEW